MSVVRLLYAWMRSGPVMRGQAGKASQVMEVWVRSIFKHSEAGCGLPHRVSTENLNTIPQPEALDRLGASYITLS